MFGSTTGSQVIKFKGNKEKNDFAKVLVKKFQQYFKENNINIPALFSDMLTNLHHSKCRTATSEIHTS